MLKLFLCIPLILIFSQEAHAVCITNFGKNVCADMQILQNVIVKTKLTKQQLDKRLGENPSRKQNNKITQLAFLDNSNLFLIPTDNPEQYAKELSKLEYIIYAQPDVLQKRHNHEQVHKIKHKDLTSRFDLKHRWQKTKGAGIKVAIIDDGFNLQHEDLKQAKLAFEYDVEKRKLDSSPKVNLDQHGTQVAGIIFAQHNSIGIDGIAPEAEFIAIRQISNITSQTLLALTVADLAGADIINCSWKSPILLQPVYDVLIHLSKHGRKGKGTAIVFSAGNDGEEIHPYSTEAAVKEVIVVGATQRYSNFGDSVDFIIPSRIKTTRKNSYGFFGGTSATAPVISGLLALKMAKNKELDTSDVIQQLKGELNEQK